MAERSLLRPLRGRARRRPHRGPALTRPKRPPRLAAGFPIFAAAPFLLVGLLPLEPDVAGRWSTSGRWSFPVGDALSLGSPGPDGDPGYAVTRNVAGARYERHQGADLSNRRRGGTVRAAAHGIVVAAADAGNGYGEHVVIAHRMPEGGVVLSIYSHLMPRTIRVTQGERVAIGQSLGKVGRTGDASAPHLHFEVRRPEDPGTRWEKAEVLDPIAFVAARLPTRQRDSTWARPYLLWAECAGLIDPADAADAPLSRGRWRRALARALCEKPGFTPGSASSPGAVLDAAGVRGKNDPVDPLDPVTWKEIHRDLSRAREFGLCMPADTTRPSVRQADCLARVDESRPGALPESLKRRKRLPTLAEISLVLADLTAR